MYQIKNIIPLQQITAKLYSELVFFCVHIGSNFGSNLKIGHYFLKHSFLLGVPSVYSKHICNHILKWLTNRLSLVFYPPNHFVRRDTEISINVHRIESLEIFIVSDAIISVYIKQFKEVICWSWLRW